MYTVIFKWQYQNGGFIMSDEFNKSGCAPSDCASCTANCESKVDEAHHTIIVMFGGGITVVNGFLLLSTSAWKYLLSHHFSYNFASIALGL